MDELRSALANATNGTALEDALADAGILGISFDPSANPFATFFEYSALNVLVCSVIPLPLAGTMVAVAALIYGIPLGMLINTVSATIGAYIGLLVARYACRPCLMRLLGRYRKKWEALDFAIVQEGWMIALLIRLAPVAPLVLSNVLLAMTSISHSTYIWTSAVGFAPANLPFAYAAQLGKSMAQEFPPKDPVLLSMSIIGLVASVAIAWKIGRIATRVLSKHGLDTSTKTAPAPAHLPASHALDTPAEPQRSASEGADGDTPLRQPASTDEGQLIGPHQPTEYESASDVSAEDLTGERERERDERRDNPKRNLLGAGPQSDAAATAGDGRATSPKLTRALHAIGLRRDASSKGKAAAPAQATEMHRVASASELN